MVITDKIKNQRPHHIGFFDADLIASLLECQMLAQRQAGFFLDIEGFMCHGRVHSAALFAALFAYQKTDARNERRNEEGKTKWAPLFGKRGHGGLVPIRIHTYGARRKRAQK
jgi:hypothetical protein